MADPRAIRILADQSMTGTPRPAHLAKYYDAILHIYKELKALPSNVPVQILYPISILSAVLNKEVKPHGIINVILYTTNKHVASSPCMGLKIRRVMVHMI